LDVLQRLKKIALPTSQTQVYTIDICHGFYHRLQSISRCRKLSLSKEFANSGTEGGKNNPAVLRRPPL
jgi:hypothetical protein